MAPPFYRYHKQLAPFIESSLAGLPAGAKILDAGCGEGVFSSLLLSRGFQVIGVDICQAYVDSCSRSNPDMQCLLMSLCDEKDMSSFEKEQFDAILAVEVLEHLWKPMAFLRSCHRMLKPSGVLVLTTPYHGYLKNLLLALFGKWDKHFQACRDGGHIKFWSCKSLREALRETGYEIQALRGTGRLPCLWRSLLVKARAVK